MFRFRLRGRWRLVKQILLAGYLFLMVYFAIPFFTPSNNSIIANSTKDFIRNNLDDRKIPEGVLEFEARFISGAGENGKAAQIESQTAEEIQRLVKKFAFNKPVSDIVSLKRNLPDSRHPSCREIVYDRDLPKASVILIFNNEALSALLRTVWSVIRNTPPEYLHEIILVDDGSNSTEITQILPDYIKYRLPDYVHLKILPAQTGLIYARTVGAELAEGEAIVFLDSHCEATKGWIEPLLQRIKDKPKNVVIPTIDSISDTNLQFFGHGGGLGISVGGFTWSGHFSWEAYSDPTGKRRPSDPAPTPTMAGGLFAADRQFFWDVGAYDRGMIGWGGENLELSFRVWRCHGSMENVPCSHVGHIFRSFHPYFIPDDSHGKNTMRMAEVWMDDYKRFFYLYRTDLRDKVSSMGDLSDRQEIKERLRCKSFRWYLDNVIPHKYRMDEEAVAWGRVRNEQWNNICFDHLQKDMGHKMTSYTLGQYPCHSFTGASQYFTLSEDGYLRNEYMCAEPGEKEDDLTVVEMVACSRSKNYHRHKWELTEEKRLKHLQSGLCLTAPSPENDKDLLLKECDSAAKEQIWNFEFSRS